MSIGDDLRAIADLLATGDVDDALREEIARHLATARAALEDAPPASRGSSVDPTDREASRAHHDEQGPLRGRANVVAPPLVFGEPVARDGVAVTNAVARCGARYEGPPGLVHGGIVAACFDEVLAVSMRDTGVLGLTRELTVRYRRPIRVDTALVFTAWIEHDDGRRALGRAACHVGDDLAADAEATFSRPRAT